MDVLCILCVIPMLEGNTSRSHKFKLRFVYQSCIYSDGWGRCFFDSLFDCMLPCWAVKQHMFQLHACWVMRIILGQKGSLGQMRDAVRVIKCHFSTGEYRDRYPNMFARIKAFVKISRSMQIYEYKRVYIIFHWGFFYLESRLNGIFTGVHHNGHSMIWRRRSSFLPGHHECHELDRNPSEHIGNP